MVAILHTLKRRSYAAASGGPATCEIIGYYPIGSSVPIGEAAADRHVFFILGAFRNGGFTLTGATVGSDPAKIHVQRTAPTFASGRAMVAMFSAHVPSGGTVAVNATYDNTPAGTPNLAVYRVTGLQDDDAIVSVNDAKDDDDWSYNLDVAAGGFVLAGLSGYGNPSRTVSCTQMTKDINEGAGDNTKIDMWSSLEESTQPGKAFSWVTSGGYANFGPFIAASFR